MRAALGGRHLAIGFACVAFTFAWQEVSTSDIRSLPSGVPTQYAEAPHVEPLALVLDTQRSSIEKLELSSRALDTEVRAWLIQRPVSSGTLDGRFFFVVGYRIGSRVVGEWSVDTKTRVVTPTNGFFK